MLDVESIGLSLSPGPRSPGCDPGIRGRRGSLRALLRLRGRQGPDGNAPKASAIKKRRQPFTYFQETRGPETKTKQTMNDPKRTKQGAYPPTGSGRGDRA
jgi:hypothetical protein